MSATVDKAVAEFYREHTRIAKLQYAQLQRHNNEYEASRDNHRLFNIDFVIKKDSCIACCDVLGQWFREDPTKPIKIILNTPGGSVFDGLALYDYIKQLQREGAKIDTATLGWAVSMGGPLLQAGTERTMGRHSYLMIHEVSNMDYGKTSDLEDGLRLQKELEDRLLEILAERSTLTKRQIKQRSSRKDWWINAQDCLELGFCDRIE